MAKARVKVDLSSLGKKLALTDVQPYYRYVDGSKTDVVEGYAYSIMSVKTGLGIKVKIAGNRQMDTPDEDDVVFVNFEGLEVFPSAFNSRVVLNGTATKIMVARG